MQYDLAKRLGLKKVVDFNLFLRAKVPGRLYYCPDDRLSGRERMSVYRYCFPFMTPLC